MSAAATCLQPGPPPQRLPRLGSLEHRPRIPLDYIAFEEPPLGERLAPHITEDSTPWRPSGVADRCFLQRYMAEFDGTTLPNTNLHHDGHTQHIRGGNLTATNPLAWAVVGDVTLEVPVNRGTEFAGGAARSTLLNYDENSDYYNQRTGLRCWVFAQQAPSKPPARYEDQQLSAQRIQCALPGGAAPQRTQTQLDQLPTWRMAAPARIEAGGPLRVAGRDACTEAE